nr:6-carboxytetrahydropterin synthase [Crenobacter caeni]
MRFEAARAFDIAGRYTGHSYLLRLRLSGDTLDAELGWLRDFGDVKRAFAPLYDALDHHLLDELPGLAATDCASLAAYLGGCFAMPSLTGVDVLQNEHDGALWRKDDACTR